MINPADQFYPGLRTYIVFLHRGNGVEIQVYDRQVSEEAPVFVFYGNQTAVDFLNTMKENNALTLPGMTREEADNFVSTGELPTGYKKELFIWKSMPQ